jgi:hypothetical protein
MTVVLEVVMVAAFVVGLALAVTVLASFCATQIRKKLEPDPARPRYFLTEARMGYRFVT